MYIETEKELCMQRIAAISIINRQLSNELIEIGYTNEYHEKFKTLEKSYKNLKMIL